MTGKNRQKVNTSAQNRTIANYLRFIIPSLVGVFLFMVPLKVNGDITIPVAFLAKQVEGLLLHALPTVMTVILLIVALLTAWMTLLKPSFIEDKPFMKSLFQVHPSWLFIRILGFIFAVMTLLKLGPEWVWSGDTGGLLLFELIPLLFTIFLFAGLFLPLLLNYGLLEFFGVMLNKVMRPVFTLPGRSSIDCLASWMGDGTIGVLLTNKQYEEGFYTKREAAVIGTTFSVVSITFSIVILTYMNLEHLFIQYYLTIVLAGFVAAVICPRIPPLSRKPNTYIVEGKQTETNDLGELNLFQYGLKLAVRRASANTGVASTVKGGVKNVFDMWFGVIPVVMALGTLALVAAEHTIIFEVLGAPFVPILSVLQVPEAAQAAQTMVVGFADMFLPAVIGSGIESDFTRFVIACVSVTQLIYMSEVGGLLLASKLPVTFLDLVIIFLERTIITLPIIVLMAHIIF
ncbi:YjiH family protein [Halalkalibacter krulwichiae]|uniref:Nucleoside recognition n=1 Tax=Halalkalibacter krulwichiae TaxID=199441 RepID=A0A1X9MC09_9BACI|nr:YjiH family protein [Halalkalibacter krulwichiae]ARK29111.1 Nucleoside recognition [Halalkalibacter krulwichiae]